MHLSNLFVHSICILQPTLPTNPVTPITPPPTTQKPTTAQPTPVVSLICSWMHIFNEEFYLTD